MYSSNSRMTSGSILCLLVILKIVAGQFDMNALHTTCATSGILCFGLKGADATSDACVKAKNCDLQVAITKSKDHAGKVKFQLMGKPTKAVAAEGAAATDVSTGVYVAVGLSTDSKMGADSVVECVHSDKTVGELHTSWNIADGKGSTRSTDKAYISGDSVSYKDGTLFCEFYRNDKTTVNEQLFDLTSNTKYHVLLAMGATKAGDANELSYHTITGKRASQEPILFKDAIKDPSGSADSDSGSSGTNLPSLQASVKALCAGIIVFAGLFY